MSNKSQWPELVGKPQDEALAIVRNQLSGGYVQIVKPGQPVTCDLRFDRVRIFVDQQGIVNEIPTIG